MYNTDTEEKKCHSSRLVPFSCYRCKLPDYFTSVPLHWHSEFEMSIMQEGCMEYICGDVKYLACEEDIVIVAPNILQFRGMIRWYSARICLARRTMTVRRRSAFAR